jgi:septum formation protein
LTPEQIHYYVSRYRPLDKAGAYGIQEWIGYVGVQRLEGSYFNVMGLPVQKLYTVLQALEQGRL